MIINNILLIVINRMIGLNISNTSKIPRPPALNKYIALGLKNRNFWTKPIGFYTYYTLI